MESDRRQKILALLKQTYPHAKVALDFHNAWELLVATILAAQCTDVRVNKVTPTLFAKYKTVDDVAKAEIHEVEKIITGMEFR